MGFHGFIYIFFGVHFEVILLHRCTPVYTCFPKYLAQNLARYHNSFELISNVRSISKLAK